MNVSGYVCNHGSPSGERDNAPPRGRYGERRQRDLCLKHTYKNITCWPATAYDVLQYIIHFFVWSLRPKHGTQPRGRSVSFPTQGTMVTYITWDVPLHGNIKLHPLGVAMGNDIPTPPFWGECKPIHTTLPVRCRDNRTQGRAQKAWNQKKILKRGYGQAPSGSN